MRTNTRETPITHGGVDIGAQWCRCHNCGTVAVCTPSQDFYTRPGDSRGPLYCLACLLKTTNPKGNT